LKPRSLTLRPHLKEHGFVEGENVAIEYRWVKIKSTGYRRWQPIWFADGSP
jgi:hypothetical protein